MFPDSKNALPRLLCVSALLGLRFKSLSIPDNSLGYPTLTLKSISHVAEGVCIVVLDFNGCLEMGDRFRLLGPAGEGHSQDCYVHLHSLV